MESLIVAETLLRIAGAVLGNLKPQKVAYCGHRFGLLTGDHHAPAIFDLRVRIADLVVQLLHDRDAGRCLVVNEHGSTEISGLKRLRDMLQMFPDLTDSSLV